MATVLVLVSRKMRGKKTSRWFARGCELAGDRVTRLAEEDYREPCTDIVLHYGFDGSRESKIAKANADYVATGRKAVYVDIGYFKRRDIFDRYEDYQRFAINDRHPTAYFQRVKHGPDRAVAHSIPMRATMNQGRKIVVCGMSTKASRFDYVEGWTEQAIVEIRKHTDRPIVYRPKPQRRKYGQLPPIAGTEYSDPVLRRLEQELQDAWAVVSHHSNAGLDALIAGVPCFQPEGVASVLGLSDLSKIEQPLLPSYEERRQLINDVCYTQWNAGEIDEGLAWRHFKDEGLL
jgi:hypothetical protein